MSAQVHYYSTGADTRLIGRIDAKALADARTKAAAHPYPGGLRFLILDYSDATSGDLPTPSIRDAAYADLALAQRYPDLRLAVVAPQDLFYGLARMWEGFLGAASARCRVVRNRNEVVAWLQEQGIAADPQC